MRGVIFFCLSLILTIAYATQNTESQLPLSQSGSMSLAQSGSPPLSSSLSTSGALGSVGSLGSGSLGSLGSGSLGSGSLSGSSSSSSSSQSVDDSHVAPLSSYKDSADEPHEKQDPVSNLISDMLHGKKVDLSAFGVSRGHTIAMGNKNSVYKDADYDPAESMSRDEEDIKKGAEAGMKRHEEELNKITVEERTKKLTLSQRKVKTEERVKTFDEDLKMISEQATKKGKEQDTKSAEQSVKKIQEAEQKRKATLEGMHHQELVQKAKMNADIDVAKTKADMERKKAQEDIHKINAQNDAKIQEVQNKADAEEKQKTAAETQQKSLAEDAKKTQSEAQSKQAKKAAEAANKQAEVTNEQNAKAARNAAQGVWCKCSNVVVYWDQNNNWNLCPAGTLLTGIYRDGSSQWLTAIKNFKCCRPCTDDGQTMLAVTGCSDGNWWGSFDGTGWSECPGNTFISGFYKSSCNYIYCLEMAKCCNIDSSQGRKSCGQRDSWGRSLDGEGWSVLDDNQFLVGLYRSQDQWLYAIEYPKQCTFFSYPKQ